MHTKEKTISILKQFDMREKKTDLPPVLAKASVLIPLFVRGGELHVWLTVRSKELRTSPGTLCFPGGKRDPGDRDDVDTALREAHEEIGLPPDEVQVVCTLYPILSKQGLLVTPVVGFIDEAFRPSPNPAEVHAVFTIPLDLFTKRDHYSSNAIAEFPLRSFHFVDPDSGSHHRIWGLTAMLGLLVAVLVFKKKPEFEIGFDHEDPSTFQLYLRHMNSKL